LRLPSGSTHICQNYIIETENYFLEGYIFNADLLVVTFEHAGDPDPRPEKFRAGWGSVPLRKRKISSLCIKPKRVDWYTRPDLARAFKDLRAHFSQFRRVVTYGCSMGGFGALTFADLIGANEVHAIAPQSTLRRNIIPKDNRFPKSRGWSFDGPFGDAVGKYHSAQRVFVYFDQANLMDGVQCNRLAAPNVTFVDVPSAGHYVAAYLTKANAIRNIIDAIETGVFDLNLFAAALHKDQKKHTISGVSGSTTPRSAT